MKLCMTKPGFVKFSHIYHKMIEPDGALKLEGIINIFVHHNIMACMPSHCEYFMPALLNPSPMNILSEEQCGDKVGDTLYVKFNNTYIPQGVFRCLVVNLAKRDWLIHENTAYKDLIKFQVKSNSQIVLYDKITHIGLEIYLGDEGVLGVTHFDIFNVYDKTLKNICSQLKIGWNFQ